MRHVIRAGVVALLLWVVLVGGVAAEDPTATPTETPTASVTPVPTATGTPIPSGLPIAAQTELAQRWPVAALHAGATAVALFFPSTMTTTGQLSITIPVGSLLPETTYYDDSGAGTCSTLGCWQCVNFGTVSNLPHVYGTPMSPSYETWYASCHFSDGDPGLPELTPEAPWTGIYTGLPPDLQTVLSTGTNLRFIVPVYQYVPWDAVNLTWYLHIHWLTGPSAGEWTLEAAGTYDIDDGATSGGLNLGTAPSTLIADNLGLFDQVAFTGYYNTYGSATRAYAFFPVMGVLNGSYPWTASTIDSVEFSSWYWLNAKVMYQKPGADGLIEPVFYSRYLPGGVTATPVPVSTSWAEGSSWQDIEIPLDVPDSLANLSQLASRIAGIALVVLSFFWIARRFVTGG